MNRLIRQSSISLFGEKIDEEGFVEPEKIPKIYFDEDCKMLPVCTEGLNRSSMIRHAFKNQYSNYNDSCFLSPFPSAYPAYQLAAHIIGHLQEPPSQGSTDEIIVSNSKLAQESKDINVIIDSGNKLITALVEKSHYTTYIDSEYKYRDEDILWTMETQDQDFNRSHLNYSHSTKNFEIFDKLYNEIQHSNIIIVCAEKTHRNNMLTIIKYLSGLHTDIKLQNVHLYVLKKKINDKYIKYALQNDQLKKILYIANDIEYGLYMFGSTYRGFNNDICLFKYLNTIPDNTHKISNLEDFIQNIISKNTDINKYSCDLIENIEITGKYDKVVIKKIFNYIFKMAGYAINVVYTNYPVSRSEEPGD